MAYPCTGCGCCCKRVAEWEPFMDRENEQSLFYFPYTWNETGTCENLTTDNKCAVYEDRPNICRIDKMGNLFGGPDWLELHIKACNQLMDQDGVDPKYRIVI